MLVIGASCGLVVRGFAPCRKESTVGEFLCAGKSEGPEKRFEVIIGFGNKPNNC